ncbi:hypothetical protein MML48_6g00004713 [Holotrichia oblita]|uniref:Uncharacterized protein n=1 Tax=Holotrichia oblita TaxID=644536 RepID=A0ACB9SXG9_HOLOL|nr:hypothetical protein MML48_6g00004713 [Holotrichia oblita]
MINKPSNLQNSAVLRMLEEEENRKRSGQPGSLKRVAWPPPNSELDEFIEQEAIHSQNYQTPSVQSQPQKPLSSPVVAQRQQQQQDQLLYQQQQLPKSSVTNTNSFQPTISPVTSVKSPQSVSQSSVGPSPYQSAPISPNVSKSPVSFTNLAKPWSPQNQSTPHFKPVQPPSLRTIQSYQQQQQSSEQYHYSQQHYQQEQTRETQTVILPSVYQTQETTFQQYQSPLIVETQRTFEVIKSHQGQEQQQPQEFTPQKQAFDLNQNKIETPKNVVNPSSFQSSTSIEVQQEVEPSKPFVQVIPQSPEPVVTPPSLKTVTPIQKVIPPKQTQSVSVDNKGAPQNQAPVPQRYQLPVKQVEPPPSTITLRPQAPVSQAPPPLVTSQPATATLRGGKHLRGDLKWPPENVRERMAAEEQHLIELSHGPAVRPRKNCKDYSSFFAKHALTHAYPGYKIPPGTQFYDHNPVM